MRSALKNKLHFSGGNRDAVSLELLSRKTRPVFFQIRITEEQTAYLHLNPRALLRQVFFSFGCGKLCLIRAGGQYCGFVCMWINPRIGKYTVAPLVIDQRFQRRGIGRQALFQVCDYLFSRGADRVLLSVHPDNFAAIAMYEQIGFIFTNSQWGPVEKVMRLDRDVYESPRIAELRIAFEKKRSDANPAADA